MRFLYFNYFYIKFKAMKNKLPVTVLRILGSEKTTLLNHILHNKENLKLAVIVNDMSEINVDVELVKSQKYLFQNGRKIS